jgi:glycosyltransferase involved in cell wall biosynthesis
MRARVCLLSPAPLWLNPRLCKEADTLYAAGYDLTVGYRADGSVERDDAILQARRWRWHRVDVARARQPAWWFTSALRQRGAQALWRAGVRGESTERAAYCRADQQLLQWAVSQRADLYIGHTQPALPIVALAAAASDSTFAFDCEDLLAEEAADGGRAAWRRTLIIDIERRYLARAAYVSATSQPMADFLESTYRLGAVRVWHNCFPISESRSVRRPDARPSELLELAWISATVGPGRGLEDIFSALPLLGPMVRLHVYGGVPPASAAWLDRHLAGMPAGTAPVMHPPLANDVIADALSRHHVGLSLDGTDCVNRALTVSNKLFHYLQAGLACVLTDTPGHRSIAGDGVRFGVRYRPGDIEALVAAIRRYLDPQARLEAQRAAWHIARAQYAWDVEGEGFLRAVADALPAARCGTGDRVAGLA